MTDGLVKRVLSSGEGRSAAEHELDQQVIGLGEESREQKQISISCDRCGIRSPGSGSVTGAAFAAQAAGWFVSDHEGDHCPACKDGSKLLPGEVSLSMARASKLGGEDAILKQRLDWIYNRILDGTSATACVYNSHTSGHRNMLSDLARGLKYDVEDLMLKIPSLALDFEVNQREREWIGNLFQILRLEDGWDP